MKKLLKTFGIVYVMIFHPIHNLITADENIVPINRPKDTTAFAQYLALYKPTLLEKTKLTADDIYRFLLDNTLPRRTKWSSFLKEWDRLDSTNQNKVISMLSQQSLQQVFIMKQDLQDIRLWLASLEIEDFCLVCPNETIFYLDFDLKNNLMKKRKIIKWIY